MKTKASLVLVLCIVFGAFLYAGDGGASSATQLPGVRVLGNISDQYKAVKYDHEKHVSLAENCAACHHHGNGDTASCKECHSITPATFKKSLSNNFGACSNCHTSNDRDNPGMPGLKVAYHVKCFQCHKGMGSIGSDPKGCTEICHAKRVKPAGVKASR